MLKQLSYLTTVKIISKTVKIRHFSKEILTVHKKFMLEQSSRLITEKLQDDGDASSTDQDDDSLHKNAKSQTAPVSNQNNEIRSQSMNKNNSVRYTRPQGNSILDFNPELPPNFTEYYTVQAMRKLGVSPNELRYPDESTLNEYSHNPRIRQVAYRTLKAEIDQLVGDVKNMRERIINEEKENQGNQNAQVINDSDDQLFVTAQEKMEKMKNQQKKEVESVLLNMLLAQKQEKEARLRAEKELERLRKRELELKQKSVEEEEKRRRKKEEKEKREQERQQKEAQALAAARDAELQKQLKLEEEKRQKALQMAEEEKQKQEKAEQIRKHLVEMEEKKKQETLERQKQQAERELIRQKKLEEQQKQQEELRLQKQQYIEEQQRRIKEQNEMEMEQRTRDAKAKQEKVERKLREFEMKRERERIEALERDQKKAEQFEQVKKKKDEERQRRAEIIRKQSEEADKRYRQMELAKQEKMNNAMMGYSEQTAKIQQKMAMIKKQKEEQNEAKLRAYREQEEKMQRQQQQAEEERMMKAVELRLQREKKAAAAHRAELRRAAEKEALKEQFNQKLARIEAIQRDKQKYREMSAQKRQEIEAEKAQIIEQINALKAIDPEKAPQAMNQLAKQFNINLEELQERLERRSSVSKSQSNLPRLNTSSQSRTQPQSARVHPPSDNNVSSAPRRT